MPAPKSSENPATIVSSDPRRLEAIVSPDPLADVPVGASIPCRHVVFPGCDATAVPDGVQDWGFFEGALLAIGLRVGDSFRVLGSGVMIAPGLAMTATHILRDHFPGLEKGEVSPMCIGLRKATVDLWGIRSVSYSDEDDLAYLSLVLRSPLPDGWHFTAIPLTTRTPRPTENGRPGERLTILGYQFPGEMEDTGAKQLSGLGGTLYAAAGPVEKVYPFRPRKNMAWPTIEIACGSVGSMSGGAVLDRNGRLMGIISRSLHHDGGDGPTWAAWVPHAFLRQLDIPWPKGAYKNPVGVMDIPNGALNIEGREAFEVLGPGRYGLRFWMEHDHLRDLQNRPPTEIMVPEPRPDPPQGWLPGPRPIR